MNLVLGKVYSSGNVDHKGKFRAEAAKIFSQWIQYVEDQ
jgi:hypothetical protein